jgi:cell wall assembly regulator SMI1
MSGDHNMNQKITGTLFSAAQVDAIEQEWRDKCQRYIDIHDAVVKDNDRLIELLRRAEVEMRYAGWNKYEADNSARNGVYEQIVRQLK